MGLLKEREQRDKAVVADALIERPGDVVSLLQALVAHDAAERNDTWLHTVLSSEATSPGRGDHDFFVARYTRVRTALARTIAKQASASGLAEDEIQALAAICMAVVDGLQVQWLLDPQANIVAQLLHSASFWRTLSSTESNVPETSGAGDRPGRARSPAWSRAPRPLASHPAAARRRGSPTGSWTRTAFPPPNGGVFCSEVVELGHRRRPRRPGGGE